MAGPKAAYEFTGGIVMIFWLSWTICVLNLVNAGLMFYTGHLNRKYRESALNEYIDTQKRMVQLEALFARHIDNQPPKNR